MHSFIINVHIVYMELRNQSHHIAWLSHMFVVVIVMRDYFCSSQQYLSVIGHFQVKNFNFCYPIMEKRSLKFCDLRKKLDHGLWRILFRKVLNVKYAVCLVESTYKHGCDILGSLVFLKNILEKQ